MLDVLVANRFARDACVVALGGGVVGDMAGFAAACYQRGISFVQVPTTLLAQVDSSVGGKTGVNHPGGKNLIGAFHQPAAVFADTDTLATLPDRELRAGLAEVIKYGLIVDRDFFDWLEANAASLLARDTAALTHAIKRSCEIKAEIVARDEHERGDRALLNLGHTFGHAIESATNYSTWLHGEAVGAGMLLAADMSQRLGWVSAADVDARRTRAAAFRPAYRRELAVGGDACREDENRQEGGRRTDPARAAQGDRQIRGHGRLRRRSAARDVARALRVAHEPARSRLTPRSTNRVAADVFPNRHRDFAPSFSAIAIASSIRMRFAASSTRPRSS